jgi:hypothetical protein
MSEKPKRKARMDVHGNANGGSVAGQNPNPTSDGVPSQDDWRDVARMIQQETDPQKMVELVQQLITRFDDEKSRKSPRASADSKS